MNSFIQNEILGRMGERAVMLMLESIYTDVREVPHDIGVQSIWADLVVKRNKRFGFNHLKYEVKTEREHTGNFFLETWSNKSTGRPGWMVTSPADSFFYLFWDEAIGYHIQSFQGFKSVFNHFQGGFPEVPQKKYVQANDTYGRIVPINADFVDKFTHRFSFEKEKALVEKANAAPTR